MNKYNNNILKQYCVLFIGSIACGKTSLIQNYFGCELFNEDYYPSSSSKEHFYHKKIKCEGQYYQINIFDYPGTEQYKSFLYSQLKFDRIIVFVFDMTNKNSFLYLDELLESFREKLDFNKVKFILIANKEDLRDKWEIKESEAIEFAQILHAKFILTSAKNRPKILKEFLNEAFCDYIKFHEKLEEQFDQEGQHNINLNRANIRRNRRLCG